MMDVCGDNQCVHPGEETASGTEVEAEILQLSSTI